MPLHVCPRTDAAGNRIPCCHQDWTSTWRYDADQDLYIETKSCNIEGCARILEDHAQKEKPEGFEE